VRVDLAVEKGILERMAAFPTAPATARPSTNSAGSKPRLLRNGAPAHELIREDRAKGGRARAEKIRKRKELRERFQVENLEELAEAELELVERGLVRLELLIASDDERVALRACKEVFDRVLGRPRLAPGTVEPDCMGELESAREKLAQRLALKAPR
jgi:hypothetical protein